MRTLDLNSLTVESFETVDGDASSWIIIPPTLPDDGGDRLYEGAATDEPICSTT